MKERRAFRPQPRGGEALMIERGALDGEFLFSSGLLNDLTEDGIAIVYITGPLNHHPDGCFDSYDEILERVECAFNGDDMGSPRAVVLCIDSPGGEASGTMYIHRKLRSLRKQYGIPLYAYSNETMCSAAYAIGSAADEIWCPDTGTVGSIGVIATMFDRTAANTKEGLLVKLITSGAFKADGHADRELTDDIESRMQAKVDKLADIFFEVVAKARGTSPKAIASLEAGVFIGQDAVRVGVADGVVGFDAFLKLVSRSLESDAVQRPEKSAGTRVSQSSKRSVQGQTRQRDSSSQCREGESCSGGAKKTSRRTDRKRSIFSQMSSDPKRTSGSRPRTRTKVVPK